MMDINEIREYLPHRYPFLLVDRVTELDVEAKRVRAYKNVTINEPFFQGHFPGHPVMPGVLIVEAMAQTAAVVVGISLNVIDKPLLTYFMGIDGCKFRRMVQPGDVLELHVTVKRPGGKIWKFEGRALVDGQLCASAEFTAMMAMKTDG